MTGWSVIIERTHWIEQDPPADRDGLIVLTGIVVGWIGAARCSPLRDPWGIMALISPALLAADFARLGEALQVIEAAGCQMVHLDVGDGHFFRDVALGQPVVESIRKATKLRLDVHLMIERPERYAADFAKAGAHRLAFHPESTQHPWRTLDLIRKAGAKSGIALQPGSTLSLVSELLKDLDFLNILTADPESELDLGERQPHCQQPDSMVAGVNKLLEARRIREHQGLRFELQAEGGIGPDNVAEVARAGADILVSGFAIFHGGDSAVHLKGLMSAADCGIAPEPAKSRESLIPSNP